MTKGICHQAIRLLQKEGDLDHHSRIIERLVAEIKRLRELGKTSIDFYIASIKFQHRNSQLIADTALEWIDEAERLERQLATKDALINDLMANCNQLRDRCWKAEGELVRWQKIAIDLKAVSYFVNFKSREQVFDLQPKEIQDKYRDRAAEELNLQVTQEAGYVKRLESAFLDMWKIQLNLEDSDLLPESREKLNDEVNVLLQKQAQAALDKIREGKP